MSNNIEYILRLNRQGRFFVHIKNDVDKVAIWGTKTKDECITAFNKKFPGCSFIDNCHEGNLKKNPNIIVVKEVDDSKYSLEQYDMTNFNFDEMLENDKFFK